MSGSSKSFAISMHALLPLVWKIKYASFSEFKREKSHLEKYMSEKYLFVVKKLFILVLETYLNKT